MKTGLVLEGGALRTIYSSGVCDAFLDKGLPLPDYTVGVSAGIAYGASYLSKQSRRNLKIVTTYANDHRYMSLRNWANPKNRAYFGLKFSYEIIPNQLVPFDYEAFEAYPGTVEAVVTNLNTGKADYLEPPRRDPHNRVFQATCAIPVMFPVIEIDEQPYLDGGCADAIPWKRAFDVGCDRVVVILTRERDYYKEPNDPQHLPKRLTRKHPNFAETMKDRSARYNRCREELFAAEKEGKLIVIAPEDTLGCSRTEKDMEVIRALWQEGYFAGLRESDRIRDYWTKEEL
jgi:predicted patatin/cPLA2 family phospholipase